MDENYLSALNVVNRTQPNPAAKKPVQTPAVSTAGTANFQQMLMGLLLTGLSSTSSTNASSTNSLFSASSSADSILGASSTPNSLFGTSSSSTNMTSVLLGIIQQLLAMQVNKLQANPNTIDLASQSGGGVPASVLAGVNPPLIGVNPTNPITGSGNSVPEGRPVGGVLTQGYHSTHHGLDFGVVVGTPVHATMDGNVIYAGWNNQGYGNLVIVQNGPYKTYYAHLSNIPVSLNQPVKAGSVVGLSGNTGNSTGPHLHYEVRKDNVAIDPTGFTLNQNVRQA